MRIRYNEDNKNVIDDDNGEYINEREYIMEN